eukprot:CAMPEP_0203908844 /NCGR_PEP_ID=MMETSP0359-20131031/50203_1 /ASSEMBLY_ACC=CAM_ASM_000338 /TAXON_ID=268821 /ORGANISM="Scrippsiella Hangoei, Strain SHTV-5" /LENGTH=174 /DNA_ID=CAMNT_0050833933 /DNA_START=78 /DNA_END=602 /DNA_ORIENTATION=-
MTGPLCQVDGPEAAKVLDAKRSIEQASGARMSQPQLVLGERVSLDMELLRDIGGGARVLDVTLVIVNFNDPFDDVADAQLDAEYAFEKHSQMFEHERKLMPRPNYMDDHSEVWPSSMVHYSQRQGDNLRGCAEDTRDVLEAAPRSALQVVRPKCQAPDEHAVADMEFGPRTVRV